jgi:nickel-dependent lactate racemase
VTFLSSSNGKRLYLVEEDTLNGLSEQLLPLNLESAHQGVEQAMINEKTVDVPILLWYGDKKQSLNFPADWDVSLYPMNGDKLPTLTDQQIRMALANPIGSKTIGQLARNKREAVVVIDDMTRGTKPSLLLPYVLKELNDNGISNDHIRFIMALGAHGTQNRMDFAKKLGEEIVQQFPCWNTISLGMSSTWVRRPMALPWR